MSGSNAQAAGNTSPAASPRFDRIPNNTAPGQSFLGAKHDEFVQHLYQENARLRSQVNQLQRELFNQSTNMDALEEDNRMLKAAMAQRQTNGASSALTMTGQGVRPTTELLQRADNGEALPMRELEEIRSALEHKNVEIRLLKEDLAKEHELATQQKMQLDTAERELADIKDEMQMLKQKRQNRRESAVDGALPPPNDPALEMKRSSTKADDNNKSQSAELATRLAESDEANQKLKRQMLHIVTESNKRHTELQNQLQGMDMLMDNIRREYEEFFDVLTDEHSAHRRQQFEETEKLKVEYESYKQAQFEEKRLIVVDYQNLIFSMQNQFEEYRAVTEFLFNGEIAKAEDELATLSLRFEQEILYIIQAKDKFYTDLMVAKDAKIMHLIEGSDLQVIMRKHEGDIENIRKDHAKDIERVKTEQESEQKSLVTLLQRQNASLESKTEKLQAHIKMLETKTKDLTAAVEHKTRALLDKEAEKLRTDEENTKTRAEMETKFRLLAQEKEHLRHKVIRLNFSARGKGADSVENIIKRVSREQESLALMYDELMEKYGTMLKSNEVLGKKLREKEKLTAFLEKEIGRRNKELESMTKTFAIFLDSRMKQTAQLSKSRSSADSPRQSGKEDRLVVDVGGKNNTPKSAVSNADRVTSQQMTELERGYAYLHRFKTLSRAFVSGDYRKVQLPKAVATDNQITGPWKNTELYAKMEGESAEFARMYGASLSKADDGTGSIPATTLYQSLKVAPIPGSASHVKVYGGPEEDPTTALPVDTPFLVNGVDALKAD